eukprot:COSAG02_NODE_1781_length_10947_cov_54.689159_4_plen_304_part_00
MAGVDEQRLGVALARWRAQGNVLPRVWTKAGGLVRQADNVVAGVPASAKRSPEGRAIVRDYTAEGARLSFAESIGRLSISEGEPLLAGLRIHDPNDYGDSDSSVDDVATALSANGMLEGLRELRAGGSIGHVSLGMNANRMSEDILRLIRGSPAGTFDSCLLAGGWNLLCQDGGPVMEEAAKRGIVIHNAGSLASGLLAGAYTYAYNVSATLSSSCQCICITSPPPLAQVADAEMVERRDKWSKLAAQFDVQLPAVAFAFAFAPSVVAKLVVGPATPEQLEANLRCAPILSACTTENQQLSRP